MVQHYVEFIYPGLLFAENSERLVERVEAVPASEWPRGAVGFLHFYRMESTEVDPATGEEVTLRGPATGHTPWTYKGKTLTLEHVLSTQPQSILAGNMKRNGFAAVVDVGGNCWPLNPGDSVLESH